MAMVQDPAVQRRRLRAELRKARNAAKVTQRDVAKAMAWSPSKVTRIEGGEVGISKTDLLALLSYYGIRDKRQIEELIELAQTSRKQRWSEYRDIIDPEFLVYLGHESVASVLRQYQLLLVPGLLQTEEYARAILSGVYDSDSQLIDRTWQARLERQELLERDDPPQLYFILDEAVVRRVVGGPDVMQRQLERLAELGARPHISIQIVPFSAGAHQGMRGPATILEFPDANGDDVIFMENSRGGGRGDLTTRDRPEGTGPYYDTFVQMEDIASPPEEIDAIVEKLIADLKSGTGLLSTAPAPAAES
jgi:transcriptional regulator with XRE-family HTH domain